MSVLRLPALLLAIGLQVIVLVAAANAQTTADGTARPAEVDQLIDLLAQPEVQTWLAEQAPADAEPAATDEPESGFAAVSGSGSDVGISAAVARWHAHRDAMIEAFPQLPSGLWQGLLNLKNDALNHGVAVVILLVVVFVGAGYAAEFAFGRATRTVRRRVLAADETTIAERLQKVAMRLALVLGAVIVFAAASLGIFVLIDLPPLIREVTGRFLFAAIIARLIYYLCQLLLAPTVPRRRVIPVDDDKAAFWLKRFRLFSLIFVVGWATVTSLRALDVPTGQLSIIAYLFGLGLLAVAIEAVWRRPGRDRTAVGGTSGTAAAIAWSGFAVLVYLVWFIQAKKLMWLLVVAAMLPLAVRLVNSAVDNLLRPIEEEAPTEVVTRQPPSVLAAAIERGARALLIVAAVWFLTWAWDIDVVAFFRGETDTSPLAMAILNIAIIVIIVDFAWHVGRTAIDRYLADAANDPDDDPNEARRRARIRTLLPIGRNIMQVVLLVAAILMILSSLGVQIAPLIAGAGVVGVAIGFGAQTLVKDIVAGMFYLLDDAFRVGEYVIAGSYKGTVESFSLRSIKLRHHRGPLFTVPFGELGAIQNASRDWVIVKMTFTVPHDTDLIKLKKVIKQVSATLMEDPEIAAGIIEPLKSQGADNITDTGIVVRLKFKAIPGQQFTARRAANALIKKAFAENGIDFAYPTVRVAGDADDAVAAKAALDNKALAEGGTQAAE